MNQEAAGLRPHSLLEETGRSCAAAERRKEERSIFYHRHRARRRREEDVCREKIKSKASSFFWLGIMLVEKKRGRICESCMRKQAQREQEFPGGGELF